MNAVKQRKQRRQLVGIVGFIIFVLLSGLALRSAGKLDDPFTNMSDIVEMRQMLSETQGDNAAPQMDEDIGNELVNAKTGYVITWSASDEVLYDLWFMCATTAFVIVLSYLLKWLVRQFVRKPS